MWQEKRFLFSFFSVFRNGVKTTLYPYNEWINVQAKSRFMTCQPFHVLLSLYMWHLSQTSKILIRKKEYTIVCVKIRAWIVNALRSFVTRVVCAKILAPFFPFPSQFKDDSTFYLSLCRIKHTEMKHLFKNRTFYAANCLGSDGLELHFE